MDHTLADEVVLRICGYLDAADLVRLQLVNTHLCSLAKDRQLWKRLFYHSFVRPADGTLSGIPSSHPLPTLRELRSLLLHQNVLTSKHVAGDGARRIHRLPLRFYGPRPQVQAALPSEQEADEAVSSLFKDGLKPSDTSKHHLIDWEQIFRVSTNWQRGRFAVSELFNTRSTLEVQPQQRQPSAPRNTVVRVSNRFILTATPVESELTTTAPSISVFPSEPHSASHDPLEQNHIPTDLHQRTPILRFSSPGLQRLLASQQPSPQVHVTEIAVDAGNHAIVPADHASAHRKRKLDTPADLSSRPISRVLVAYSTGHISLFSLTTGGNTLECTEDVFQRPETMASGDSITMAAMHYPALVLCSSKFDISFYRLSTTSTVQLDLVHRLSSYRCSWPASLRLKKLPYHDVSKRVRRTSSSSRSDRHALDDGPEEHAFRVTLAYSTPSYPSSWCVSVQEVVVRLNLNSTSANPAQVTSRHATAKPPFRPTPIDPRGRSMLDRHQSSASSTSQDVSEHNPIRAAAISASSRSTSLTYDDPFVVLGASDNMVEVYELLGATTFVRRSLSDPQSPVLSRSATATPSSPGGALRLVHRRSLHGHTGSVHSVALEDGRCVSGGADGSVMVWSLGDRANETDSIASAMRNVRATARGLAQNDFSRSTGARSTSSTIVEEDEDEAASHMAHVLTLSSSFEPDQSVASSSSGGNASYGRGAYARSLGPSLGQIVRSRVLDRQARGVIRWVSTAFDKIVSIVAYTDMRSGIATGGNTSIDAQHPRERVQVWSFG